MLALTLSEWFLAAKMIMQNKLKLLVASHKPYWMPAGSLYLPVQVGSAGRTSICGFQRDDEGENISFKNPRYCELTALYWGWKNLDFSYLGLAHYRRYFAGSGERGVATEQDIMRKLDEVPVVLPKKRRYYIETVESHYAHTFEQAQLDVLRGVLARHAPDVLPYFNKHMESRSAHIWNMMVMRQDIVSQWCEWLFPILQQVEDLVDFSQMSPFEARLIGRLSERLLDPWLASRAIPFSEMPVISLEKVRWGKKGRSFLAAKFRGHKYTESF